MIDLDANATTPMLPEVLDAMLPWLREGHANPSGTSAASKLARGAIEQARALIAGWIGAEPDEIVFTSGGTESVNSALRSLDAVTGPGSAVVSAIEHSAVLRCVENMTRETRRIPVDKGGRLDLTAFTAALEGAAWVSIMAANNETGVIQPLREVVDLAHERGLPVHSDAVQAAGKIPLAVKELGVDLLSLSAHKFHGPKGVGVLYVRRGLRFEPWLRGGGQEAGRRAGTENTAGIVGMAAAAAWISRRPAETREHPASLPRDAFEAKVLAEIQGITVNGDKLHRLPNTSHLSFDECDTAGLLILLEKAGVLCSGGSACLTGQPRPSHVQLAMGIPEARARTSLRISFSLLNTLDEALAAADAVKQAVAKLRRVQGSGMGPVLLYSP